MQGSLHSALLASRVLGQVQVCEGDGLSFSHPYPLPVILPCSVRWDECFCVFFVNFRTLLSKRRWGVRRCWGMGYSKWWEINIWVLILPTSSPQFPILWNAHSTHRSVFPLPSDPFITLLILLSCTTFPSSFLRKHMLSQTRWHCPQSWHSGCRGRKVRNWRSSSGA